VQGRRASTQIILHRGAADLAVENTLAAFEAGFLHGGDGGEVDIRKTRDGVLVALHDPWVDRVLDAFGPLREFTYEELALCRFREAGGLMRNGERVPTLREIFEVCRKHCGLLHLDVKAEGVDGEILALLEEMNLLENVVTVNADNADAIRADERIRVTPSQGAIIHGGNDYDRKEVRKALERPAKGTLLVDDPRCAAALLGRRARGARRLGALPALPECRESPAALLAAASGASGDGRKAGVAPRQALAGLLLHYPEVARKEVVARFRDSPPASRADWLWALGRLAASGTTLGEPTREHLIKALEEEGDEALLEQAAAACGEAKIAGAVKGLLALLQRSPGPAAGFSREAEQQRQDARRIRLRAAAIKALGKIGISSPEVIAALHAAILHRSLHLDGAYQALDGAEAAKALAALGSAESVPVLKEAILRADPRLAGIAKHEEHPWWLRRSPAWWDFRLKTEALAALGKLGTPAARETLRAFLALPAERAEEAWRELYWDAARALCAGPAAPAPAELRALLEHSHPAVRRTASAYLVNLLQGEYRALARDHLPWVGEGEE
jgi:glycerophosphoryl diester phosphodiesterase/HEAT repeat protein